MSRTVTLIISIVLSMTFAAAASAHTVITRLSDGQSVTLPQLMAATQGSELVLIGESHDNKSHHEMQLALIRSLYEKNQLAIGLEMIQTDSQKALDAWVEGRMNEQSMVTVFAQNWSMDWDMYRDIFMFAREKQIPMVALNVPIEIVKKVAHHGYGSLSASERKDLPSGTSCDLNNPHTQFLRKTFQEVANHSGNHNFFTYFCEAQTLRNSAMALNIQRYLEKHPKRKVVVLTGVWHAIKNAIPEQLQRNGSKIGSTVILPEIPEVTDAAGIQADYLVEL